MGNLLSQWQAMRRVSSRVMLSGSEASTWAMPPAWSSRMLRCAQHDMWVSLLGVNLSPCERQAGHPQGVALISVNLSPCERDAGHPQGVALLYAAAPQALRHVRLVGPPLAGGLRRP